MRDRGNVVMMMWERERGKREVVWCGAVCGEGGGVVREEKVEVVGR